MYDVTLILTAADGTVILRRSVRTGMTALAGTVGQTAHEVYGEASRLGFSPIGTVLTVEETDPADIDAVVARARAIVRKGR